MREEHWDWISVLFFAKPNIISRDFRKIKSRFLIIEKAEHIIIINFITVK
jgi:hypothetical protein